MGESNEYEILDADVCSLESDDAATTTGDRKGIRKYLGDIVSFCATAAVVFVLFNAVFTLHIIPSGSMEPTIKTNSMALCWRIPYLLGDPAPKYGDIVSFKQAGSNRILIKRVIGLPGDEISFADGYVYRNGEKLEEMYVCEEGKSFSKTSTYEVPANHFFVLGDNRQNSSDSRAMKEPFVAFNEIYAKMLFAIHI